MPIPLTSTINTQISNQVISAKFTFTVNGVDYTSYMLNWNTSFNTQFGSASASFTLNNDTGLFSEGGASAIKVGDVVAFIELFQGDSTQFKRFYGIVDQRSIMKAESQRSITLNCLDYISILKNWDIDTVIEGTKVEIDDETLIPQYLPSPNNMFSQVFNFRNSSIAQNPLPIIFIQDKLHLTQDPQNSGFDVLYDVGQIKFGSPLNARDNYDVIARSYFFYTQGLYVEDILQTLLTTANGYGGYLFGESSAANVIKNHFRTTFQDEEGAGNSDVLTPNTTASSIIINHTLSQSNNAGDTSIYLDSIAGLPASGTGTINGDTFTWTGIVASTKQLTGIPSTGTNALSAHPISSTFAYTKTYDIGQVWYLKYSNLFSTLTSANFTIPAGCNINYVDARYGRIILDHAISLVSFVRCNYNYEFNTLQATGVQLNYIAFRSREVSNRFEAINQLFQYLAPNYIIRTQGDNKIWASFLYQKTTADYTLNMPTSINYLEDPDLYTRVKFFGTNKNPTNIMFSPNVAFSTTGQTYKAFASQSQLQFAATDGNGYQVYDTLLTGVGYITSDFFTPIVRINGIAIDNQVHQLPGIPVTIQSTTTTTTKVTSSKFGGSKTETNSYYYYVIHFANQDILPTQQILLYNPIGQNTYTISPNDSNMNYGAGIYTVPGSSQNTTVEQLSTATYWVQYSTSQLKIDYSNVQFKISNQMIPDPSQANVTADFEYYTVFTPQKGVQALIDGRLDTQVQTEFFSQPPTGYQYAIIDLGSLQTIQAIDIIPGYYEPDQYRKYDVDFRVSLRYSLDNITFFDISDKTQNVQLTSGTSVSLEEKDLGTGFQTRYLMAVLENVKELNFGGRTSVFTTTSPINSQAQIAAAQVIATTSGGSTSVTITEGVWPVALTELSAYSDIVISSTATLIPTCITTGLVTSATTTINVDSTSGFTQPSSGSTQTAYIGTSGDNFSYTGLTATSFLGCHVSSGVNAATGSYIYQAQSTSLTLYDNDLLLRSLGDRLYKENKANNNILYAQADLDSLAYNWLREYYKNHSKVTIDILYAPYLKIGQTVALTDTYNNKSATLYFIEGISERESGMYSLNLARYP